MRQRLFYSGIWMSKEMEKIEFIGEDGEKAEFYVLEQTTVGGISYILVTDSEEEDGEAMILKDLSETEDTEAHYEIVSDDDELNSLGRIFAELLESVDIV